MEETMGWLPRHLPIAEFPIYPPVEAEKPNYSPTSFAAKGGHMTLFYHHHVQGGSLLEGISSLPSL